MRLAKTPMDLEDMATYFAFKLGAFFTIVVIDVNARRITMRTPGMLSQVVFCYSDLDGLKRFTMLNFIGRQQGFEI